MIMSFRSAVLAALTLVAITAIVAFSALYANEQDNEKMKACVTSGHQWKRDSFTSYYECVNN